MESLWEVEAPPAEPPAPPLRGEVRADVCVVGGGFLGLWTALRVAELAPAANVVLLEAGRCGCGAAGRNGGFVLSWWSKFPTLEKLFGTAEALRLARASSAAIDGIERFARTSGISCDLRRDGWAWTATGPAQRDSWAETVARLESLGASPFTPLGPDEAAALTGSPAHLSGVLEHGCGTVQPAALARGLRGVAIDRGLSVHEDTPMRRLDDDGGGRTRVVTPDGSVVADRVVLALSAWTGIVPELRRHLIVVGSDVVATAPAPEALERIGWRHGPCVSDSRSLVHYYRTTADGRVVFGKGGGSLAFRSIARPSDLEAGGRPATVERHLRATYPALAAVPVDRAWSGPVDRTRSAVPFFSRLRRRPGVAYGFGFSGNGVGPSWLGGRILASLALGLDDEWSGAALVRDPDEPFPPEPVRSLGGRAVRAAVVRKERLEDEGRRPGLLTRSLAGLVPMTRGD